MCFPSCPRGETPPSAPIAKASAAPVNSCRYAELLDQGIASRDPTLLKNITIWNVAHQIEAKQADTGGFFFCQANKKKTLLYTVFFRETNDKTAHFSSCAPPGQLARGESLQSHLPREIKKGDIFIYIPERIELTGSLIGEKPYQPADV